MNEIKEIDYDRLGEVLEECLEDEFCKFYIDRLDEVVKLSSLIILMTPYVEMNKITCPVDLNTSVKEVTEFFYDFDYNYGQSFENIMREKDNYEGKEEQSIKFYRILEENQEREYEGQNYFNNSVVESLGRVHIDYDNTLEDEFSIAHESTHKFSQQREENSTIKSFLGESTSIAMEFLLEDYLVKKGKYPVEEIMKNREKRIVNTYTDAASILVQKNLLDLYRKNNNHIDKEIWDNYVESMQGGFKIQDIMKTHGELFMKAILKNGYLDFILRQRYVIGTLVACDFYHKIKEFPEKKEELKSLIHILGNSDFEMDDDLKVLETLDIPVVKDGEFKVDGLGMVRLQNNYLESIREIDEVKRKNQNIF